jgi:hypothetical protein
MPQQTGKAKAGKTATDNDNIIYILRPHEVVLNHFILKGEDFGKRKVRQILYRTFPYANYIPKIRTQ